MRRVHRAFEAFDDPDGDLTQFVEQRIFLGVISSYCHDRAA
jgi:hypothetical protein